MRGAGAKRLARGAGLAVGLPALTLGIVLGVRAAGGSEAGGRATAPRAAAAVASHTCRVRPTLIGTVSTARVAARTAPDPTAPVVETFDRINVEGSPQVFLLEGASNDGRWQRALLPVRPNGTTGYVPTADLTLSTTRYRIEVDRAAHRLTLWRGCDRVERFPVAVGKPGTPTPSGTFYLDDLMKPPTPDTVYGAYAYGLSGYSAAITNWRWGGVIGLHGTNDPSSIGRSVSHGCVRMRNADISRLVRILPLGTPITIR